MSNSRPIIARTKQTRRLLLLATLGLSTGCSTISQYTGLAHQPARQSHSEGPAGVRDANLEVAKAEPNSTVKQVAYDDVIVQEVSPVLVAQQPATSSLSDFMPLDTSDGDGMQFLQPVVVEQENGIANTSGMTVEQFESLALGNNPTIAELVATTQKAAGFRTQVGLRANPSIGYQANQLADQGTDQHTVFISQTIITADKLALNRSVLNEALRAQLLQLEAQKYRVATDIRIKFFEALAAQRRMELIQEFQTVSDKGLEFAELRKKAEEGSQLDVVQAKVLKNEVDLQLQQAVVRFNAAWRELAALAGTPEMSPTYLQGRLPQNESAMDWNSVASTIVVSSPEYQAAQARVNLARASICRHEVQPIPNLDVQFAAGVDNGTNNGLINLQIGAPIPVFNKNQGNLSAARAEYVRASREVERIENAIKARLASAAGNFDASLAAVDKYARDILPNAQEGLELAEIAYKAGETSYVQVLIAQRSYFDTNLQYIAAQALLGQARARVDGYVLTGALDPIVDNSGDDSLRGLTFSQQ